MLSLVYWSCSSNKTLFVFCVIGMLNLDAAPLLELNDFLSNSPDDGPLRSLEYIYCKSLRKQWKWIKHTPHGHSQLDPLCLTFMLITAHFLTPPLQHADWPSRRALTCRVWLTSQQLHSLAGSIVNNITADIYVIYNKFDFWFCYIIKCCFECVKLSYWIKLDFWHFQINF